MNQKTATQQPATQEAYVEGKGLKCPACGSSSISGDGVMIESGTATQQVHCMDCDAGWTDEYVLTGYSNLET